MSDLNQVRHRLKHTMVNTRGILHTWQKGAIFRNKTTGVQNCTRGIHSTRSMSHILQTNRHNLTTQLTLFVHAIGITVFIFRDSYGFTYSYSLKSTFKMFQWFLVA